MKDVIEDVFSVVVEQLVVKGYVKLENYFLDGSTPALVGGAREIEADANKHKLMWKKRWKWYEGNVKAQIKAGIVAGDRRRECQRRSGIRGERSGE